MDHVGVSVGAPVYARSLARTLDMEWLTLFAAYAVAIGAVLAYVVYAP
jgi:hypothetical protein